LLLVVPPRPPILGELRTGSVRVDHLGRGDHGVGARLPGYRDTVLDLGAHDPSHAHASSLAAPEHRSTQAVPGFVAAAHEPVPVRTWRRGHFGRGPPRWGRPGPRHTGCSPRHRRMSRRDPIPITLPADARST